MVFSFIKTLLLLFSDILDHQFSVLIER